jgi:hypothetical protein
MTAEPEKVASKNPVAKHNEELEILTELGISKAPRAMLDVGGIRKFVPLLQNSSREPFCDSPSAGAQEPTVHQYSGRSGHTQEHGGEELAAASLLAASQGTAVYEDRQGDAAPENECKMHTLT